MIYKEFKGKKLSWLGMGCMRMPGAAFGPIDEDAAMDLVERAYLNGVNFFDTAYFYHGGTSENFIGRALGRYPRETWYLSSKMPGNFLTYKDGRLHITAFSGKEAMVFDGPGDVFEYQLVQCGVDYFDFYMLHNMAESTYDFYTNEEIGVVDYLVAQKQAGRIGHLGFSSHGSAETIDKFLSYLDSKGVAEHFEFAMIQLNYLDWTVQEAGEKYDVLTGRGLAVFVMEPVRGGKLCNLGDTADAMLKAARPDYSQAAWAFRFLQSLDNIPIIISGMSTPEQLKENLELFDSERPLTAADRALLEKVVTVVAERVPCTNCRYCVDACLAGLDIPRLLTMYNEAGFDIMWTLRGAINALPKDKTPENCTGCGVCNPLCPQNIDIPAALIEFAEQIKE